MSLMVLAFQFTDTLNLGALILLIFGGALALLFTVRSNVVQVWRNNYEASRVEIERLANEVTSEREKKHAALGEVAALKLTRDLTPVITSMGDLMEKVVAMQEEGEARHGIATRQMQEMFNHHETQSQARHVTQIAVLDDIADNLERLCREENTE